MAVGRSEETALGSARGRFLESLPRKAIELRGTIATLTATPDAEGPRAELRRKLHALYASALVFRSDALAALVQEGITCLDDASQAGRALAQKDLELLSSMVKRLTELRSEERFSAPAAKPLSAPPAASFARQEAPAQADSERPKAGSTPAPATRSTTLTGLLPVGVHVATPSEMPGRLVVRGSSRPSAATELARAGRSPMLQRVLHVLLVADPANVSALGPLLSDDGLRVSGLTSARAALDSIREEAPDVIVAQSGLALSGPLLASLRADPLTDFVPVVLVSFGDDGLDVQQARSQGADELLHYPVRSEQLKRVLGRVTGTLVEANLLAAAPQEATLDEVYARLSDEIRRGLLDAAESGRELKVPVGDSAEIMAAAWAAVARVRAVFAERSAGRVRFSERSAGAPALLSLSSPTDELAALAGESPLSGRRIVVADDDTAVVLFFAGLLRDEGAYVTEVSDGGEALRAARSERPDLVISDVVMPGLDGFALCRELKRDPLLADVPVILISWKEDLLARMRELSSGATAYLRKEASAAQILASVREALRPRARLEAQLAEPGEVRGNLEGTGVVALMRSVRRARPDARITLRDAWNLFECELREGRLVQLTRTASDGSFVRNEAALPQLLGISAGRYSVSHAEGALKQALAGTLDEALARGAKELGAQLDALSGSALQEVARVVLDEDAQVALLDHAPAQVRAVVERLAQGDAPRTLWRDGVIEQSLLEAMLLDMAKRGSLRAVLAEGGEDLVARARASRDAQPAMELASPLSLLPPAPAPVISVLPVAADELREAADPLGSVASLPSPLLPGPLAPVASILPPAPPPGEVLGEEPAPLSEPPSSQPAPTLDSALEQAGTPADAPAPTQPVQRSWRPSDPRELERAAADARTSRGTLWAWTAAFLALVAVGFLADRAREPDRRAARIEAIGSAPSEPASAPSVTPPSSAPEAPVSAELPSAVVAPQLSQPAAQEGGFQIYDRLLESSVKVGPEQALLVVEATPADADAQLTVDGKPVGGLPAKVALSEGIHELAIARGDTVTYRFLAPRRGSTWVLRGP